MKPIDHRFLQQHGIIVPEAKGFMESHELGMDHSLAMDAQPALVSVNNAGVPAFLLNYLDPEMIRVMVTPMKAATIFGETKKGDWTTQTAMFPLVESTGEVSSYGDYNNNGSTGSNVNWPNRQSYLFQTVTQWGELEMARAGEAKINYAANLNVASALTLGKFLNKTYFFGVSGLDNYGLLNDPSLSAAITPATKTAGGTTWAVATAAEVYTDVLALYNRLLAQTGGLIDMNTPMVLALSNSIVSNLNKVTAFNVQVRQTIKDNFPNMRIESAVEYSTTGGELIQLIAEKIDGQDTGYCAFSEKMRAHAIKVDLSSFSQKKTSGTWGAIVRIPAAIAQMLGA